jgi:hypothetical protein
MYKYLCTTCGVYIRDDWNLRCHKTSDKDKNTIFNDYPEYVQERMDTKKRLDPKKKDDMILPVNFTTTKQIKHRSAKETSPFASSEEERPLYWGHSLETLCNDEDDSHGEIKEDQLDNIINDLLKLKADYLNDCGSFENFHAEFLKGELSIDDKYGFIKAMASCHESL